MLTLSIVYYHWTVTSPWHLRGLLACTAGLTTILHKARCSGPKAVFHQPLPFRCTFPDCIFRAATLSALACHQTHKKHFPAQPSDPVCPSQRARGCKACKETADWKCRAWSTWLGWLLPVIQQPNRAKNLKDEERKSMSQADQEGDHGLSQNEPALDYLLDEVTADTPPASTILIDSLGCKSRRQRQEAVAHEFEDDDDEKITVLTEKEKRMSHILMELPKAKQKDLLAFLAEENVPGIRWKTADNFAGALDTFGPLSESIFQSDAFESTRLARKYWSQILQWVCLRCQRRQNMQSSAEATSRG